MLGLIFSIAASEFLDFKNYVIFLFVLILIAIILDYYTRKSMWERDKYQIRSLK